MLLDEWDDDEEFDVLSSSCIGSTASNQELFYLWGVCFLHSCSQSEDSSSLPLLWESHIDVLEFKSSSPIS